MIARMVLVMTVVAAATVSCSAAQLASTKGGEAAVRSRAPYFEGAKSHVVGRTTFEGVFEKAVQADGLSDLEADRDPDKSPKDQADRKITVEEEAAGRKWRSVSPDGEEMEHDLPLEVVRALMYDPKDFLKRPTSDVPKDDGDDAEDGKGRTALEREKALSALNKIELPSPTDVNGKSALSDPRMRASGVSAILGADHRAEVSPANWRPAKQSGHLTFNGGSCSGALVGPKHVLTAAHCVHSGGRNGDWFGGYQFSPGSSSGSGAAYGTYGWSRVTTFSGWTQRRDSDYDLAVITLTHEITAPGVGWLSFGWSSGMSSSWYMYHKGYSGDKAWGSQWSTHGSISNVWSRRFYTDTTDTVGGNSGGPVYKYNGNAQAVIYGPHSGWNAYWYWWGAKRNRHTRITSSVFASMCDWIDDARVC